MAEAKLERGDNGQWGDCYANKDGHTHCHLLPPGRHSPPSLSLASKVGEGSSSSLGRDPGVPSEVGSSSSQTRLAGHILPSLPSSTFPTPSPACHPHYRLLPEH